MYDRFQMLDVEIGLPSSCKNNRSCCLACCSFDISCGKIDHKVYKSYLGRVIITRRQSSPLLVKVFLILSSLGCQVSIVDAGYERFKTFLFQI
jgi:hypothetical protein